MSTPTVDRADPRALITAEEFAAVVGTVLRANPGLDQETAERIVAEALKFVATSAVTEHTMAPSRVVDEGWHALILHTRTYAQLCADLGRHVHHVPQPGDASGPTDILERTRAAMEAAGYPPDPELWRPSTDTTITVSADCQHLPPKCEDHPCETPQCDSSSNGSGPGH
ncbi:glycine-rich domain-containing protein [Streptomyces aidingensis]|uniref:Uncharacterized protein n=1 Tax=Streptomyces aidingensis TaxID=910347 RepID=A0A1I1Q2M4_9ACTN|nr:hypothetical protein [Streptomyces aidingensis]SFD12400.1 hypothetical protein SAMN05421773_1108 [Streptomyces aidingensis]